MQRYIINIKLQNLNIFFKLISIKKPVVIRLKIRTFVVATTTRELKEGTFLCCDLLENTYLCGSNNNKEGKMQDLTLVVICLKIRTFVVATTTEENGEERAATL